MPLLKPLKEHSQGQPSGYLDHNIKNGYLILAFPGAHKWAEVLGNPYVLGGLQTRGQNQKGSRRGDKIKSGYITPAFLGFPIVGRHEQETKRCLFSMQEWCLSIEPFFQPPPQILGALLTPTPPSLARPTCPDGT